MLAFLVHPKGKGNKEGVMPRGQISGGCSILNTGLMEAQNSHHEGPQQVSSSDLRGSTGRRSAASHQQTQRQHLSLGKTLTEQESTRVTCSRRNACVYTAGNESLKEETA